MPTDAVDHTDARKGTAGDDRAGSKEDADVPLQVQFDDVLSDWHAPDLSRCLQVVVQSPDAEAKYSNEESLELTQETAETAYARLGLRDAGGIWACASADQLLAWLNVAFHDEKNMWNVLY